MGISGLLPLLKSIQRPTELKKFSGETFAVDAYGWLHRGAISCAMELAQGKPTRKYVDSFLNRVRMVQHFGVIPYLVFDGDFLPSKAATEASRAKRREESRKAGEALIKAGNTKQAFLEFQKAIDITPEMACHVIEELKKLGLPYIVAPYEADAQMVYLEREGLVSGILSEDSDLLVFGAKRLLTKMDMQGHCIEINRRDFCACREISLTDWTDREFRHMAILSGCDYLEGIGNLGLKTAYRMIRKHKTVEKVVRMLQFDGKFRVHENYLASFRQAELTFIYQRVFCPVKQELAFLTEPTASMGLDLDGMRFIGQKMDHDVARGVALGQLNPMTKDPIVLPLSPDRKRRASGITGYNPFPSTAKTPSSIGKSIDSYFGKRRESAPQRIPLGAMDPNCFSVDRQQVAALTQNGLVPRVFPLPRPYVEGGRTSLSQESPSDQASTARTSPPLRRRLTEPLSSLLQLTPAPTPTDTASRRKTYSKQPPPPPPPPKAARAALSRPPKKARLTEDDLSGNPPAKSLERSKYFSRTATATEEPKLKRRTTSEAFLMSDDSVEEAMLSLSECGGWSTQSTIKVFKDTQPTNPEICSAQEAPELPWCSEDAETVTDSFSVPQSDGIEVPAGPVGKATQPAQSTEQTKATPLARPSLSRFSYNSTTRIVHGLPTPESSFSYGRTQQLSAARPNVLTPPSTAGRKSASRSTKVPRKSLSDFVEAASTERPERPRNTNKQRRSLGPQIPVNPSFVPLPRADLAEVEALNSAQGSEDQIVPDSGAEDEDGDFDEQHGVTGSKTSSGVGRLDLSRFLCN
ncbi:exodeoxyribonuclease 1 [Grosmannia clavigera kw1407]|uniref:Exodeoxyribonuclease 1 n=1 Tax=Grosmannia clavigera (strain kw1407 / UAMH 11150) TaxID=655863 RepID=F0XEI8_GROCL|nr:exodeoxyribonuclease 1 [Grosmannia clavigera kw1407]EFX03726.1 exodeoxyribonuclease 1 [Grosmannia clavigera kw1407]